VKLEKEFDVRCSRDAAVAAVAREETLLELFPDTKTEVVSREGHRTTLRSHYRALGQAGTATFHFHFEPGGDVRFEKVCDGRVWRRLEGRVAFEARGACTRVRIEMEGRTRPLVPELAIRGPLRDQIEKMAGALRERLEARQGPGAVVPFVSASDGVRLYAEAHGGGSPVVLSCALHTTCENWRPQVPPLVAAGYRVVLWDYRGHGRSDAPGDPEAYSMERVVEDLAQVLDALAPRAPVVLGGLSFGGLASLHFALGRPERVRALLLVASGPGFKNPEAQRRWEESVERSASYLERKGLAAFVESRAAETLVGRRPELPAAREAARAIAAQRPHGLAHFGRRVAAPAPCVIDDLPRIEAPALVVVGEHDAAYLRSAEVLAAKLRRAERVTIPEAGHVVNIEQAEAFDDAVLRFLARVAPPEP
jgi:pimeloyl-ACP methyl ester carboxylesterase